MTVTSFRIRYPRKRLARGLVRLAGRLLLPLLFRLEITGRDGFPRSGPLLIVGNHTAAMEAVLLTIYSPRQIEMLSAADTPAERATEAIADFYGVIPLHRGSYDRAALESALDVLQQNGFIGLFPEGGIWEEGKKKALPGIAWLSCHSGAPVLPVGFSDTSGALHAAGKLRRPKLSMHIGELIPPARLPAGKPRKTTLQEYADMVMEAVHRLVPQEAYTTEPEIVGESFELAITAFDARSEPVPLPAELGIQESTPLAKFLHRPAILKIFRVNLALPVVPLETLQERPRVSDLIRACQGVLDYLKKENPYLLTYRFGVKEGLAMQRGLEELLGILCWCQQEGYSIQVEPVRHYYSLKEQREITQVRQGQFQAWM